MLFTRQFFGTGSAERDRLLRSEAARAAEGLDIEEAIATHRLWKQQLRARLLPQESVWLPKDLPALEREVVSCDDRCELGRWIHGRGRARLGTFPGFTDLMAHHRMFHHVAGNVMALQERGKFGDARRMLEDQFEDYSERVVADLQRLQHIVGSIIQTRS